MRATSWFANELLDTANRGTSGHTSIPGMLIEAPHISTTGGGETKRHQSLQIAVPQCVAQGLKRRAQVTVESFYPLAREGLQPRTVGRCYQQSPASCSSNPRHPRRASAPLARARG